MSDETLRLLVPLDGSPTAETILPALMPVIAHRPAALTLLQVVGRVEEIEPARAYLVRTERDLQRDGVQAIIRLEFGRPVEEILHLARPKNYDFVAMGTHGRTGLRRAFMGSVTEGVLRHAELPLLMNRTSTKIGD